MTWVKGVLYGIILLSAVCVQAQIPHGPNLQINCNACHTTQSWTIHKDSISFDHQTTAFSLEGQHQVIDCRQCHISLEFDRAETNCASCHLDIHQQSVGDDCARCHDPQSWLVNNIAEVHRQIAFPLLGAHAQAHCNECHKSESALRFDPIGTDCFSCHQDDYQATTNPNHQNAGFSTDCIQCHRYDATDWNAADINHDFFPLTKGHDIQECAQCHLNSDYSTISSACITCHEDTYLATTQPDHQAAQIPTDCASCHTTDPGWRPAEFRQHDPQYFPIYSGSHEGEWQSCSDCHDIAGNYTAFTCTTCHEQNETANEHEEVFGYTYTSTACLACHPTGEADGAFNHDDTGFSLTGAHSTAECLSCHASGFSGTPNACFACHSEDFNSSLNPSHPALGLSTDCAACHTTNPEWNPALFDIHDDFYTLNGAHRIIANQCADCHHGNYNQTPTTCVGCHLEDFNQTTDPSHTALQFSTDCATCHSENTWVPSTFDHDQSYFPIYSGAHGGQWNDCIDCHTTPGNLSVFTCITCHTQPETQEDHMGVAGYIYASEACLACHPTGEATGAFDHNQTDFPLTGAHTSVDCINCHAAGYSGTPTDCQSCHLSEYNQSANPNHSALGFVTDCASCHTTNPGWSPASFGVHDQYYVLQGAHTLISQQCATCHQGDYTSTPNTCAGCHQQDYDQTTDPSHAASQFPTECTLCHNESAWEPSTFSHDNTNFPLTGAHTTVNCLSCHAGGYQGTPTDCAFCHNTDYQQTTNPNHGALGISTDCISCHTTNPEWNPAAFDIHNQYYALNGAHTLIADQCVTCHQGDYNNTPNTCFGCHQEDFDNTTDPSHLVAGFGTDCAVCHNENVWQPANFDHDAQYFPIYSGDHEGVWTQCSECHINPNNFSVFTCVTCHGNPETDNAHMGVSGYAYNDVLCLACHPTGSADMTFDHNNTNFPLTGAHLTTDCMDCHSGGFAGTPTACDACHLPDYNQSTNPNHITLALPTDCASCHTTSPEWNPATFDIHNNYYALNGAHALIANQCVLCHNGDYNNTPNTCFGCHQDDYNQTNNPPHQALNFSTDCATCHSETAWEPASYTEHDDVYFPIYSGDHEGVWDQCSECHINPNNYSIYSCVVCHINPETNQQHVGVSGYFYENSACLACHPTGDAQNAFDHNQSNFPLTGAHIGVNCAECHSGGYQGTPTECEACHIPDYNQSGNPSHVSLSIPTNCVTCHTTNPDWNPALFPIHNDYYPLLGAHAAIADQCVVCHNGDYNNTPNTCVGCHLADYNQTNDPDHEAAQFPTTCELCHSQNAWIPANWDHDEMYFPIYSGKHEDEWNQCSDCHTNPNNYSVFTCLTCHLLNETNEIHDGVNGYQYNSAACLACHPDGEN